MSLDEHLRRHAAYYGQLVERLPLGNKFRDFWREKMELP
jgi:hypothetical protein